MSLQSTINQVISETIISTLGNLAQSIFYILAIYFGLRYIGKAISEGVKKMPSWINLYFIEMQKAKTLDRALERKYG